MGNETKQIQRRQSPGINVAPAAINTTVQQNAPLQQNMQQTDLVRMPGVHLLQQPIRQQAEEEIEQNALQERQQRQPLEAVNDDMPIEDITKGNRYKDLTKAMDDVRSDERFWAGDSWRMKLIKSNIDRTKSFFSAEITANTEPAAMCTETADRLLELIRTCREYLTARKAEKDENTRHLRVRTLYDAARRMLAQVTSLRGDDITAVFAQEQGQEQQRGARRRKRPMTIGRLLEQDAARSVSSADARTRSQETLDAVYAKRHFFLASLAEEVKDDIPLHDALQQYLLLLRRDIPADPAKFGKRKKDLEKALQNAASEAIRVANEGAWLDKSKARRDAANRLINQLRWEQDRVRAATMKNTLRAQAWSTVLEGTECRVPSGALTERQQENFKHEGDLPMKKHFRAREAGPDLPGQEGTRTYLPEEFAGMETNRMSHGIRGTELMAGLLGVTGLFGEAKEVTLTNSGVAEYRTTEKGKKVTRQRFAGAGQKGFLQDSSGDTLSQVLEQAKKLGVNLVYSEEALMQLTTIHIMDTICGQVQRDENSLRVHVDLGSKEGENYLFITSVMAVNNEYSFGTAGFDAVNKKGVQSTLKPLWNEEKGRMTLLLYDVQLADRILGLDLEAVKQAYRDKGFDEERIDALINRLEGVRHALQKDKEEPLSLRTQYDKLRAAEKYTAGTEKEREKTDKNYIGLFGKLVKMGYTPLTYIDPALVRDIGITEELSGQVFTDRKWDITEANRYADDKLNSVQQRKSFFKAYEGLIAVDAANVQRMQYSTPFFEILGLMSFYIQMDVTSERATALSDSKVRMEDYLKGLHGYTVEEPFRTELLQMDPEEGLPALENDVVRTLRQKLRVRIDTLTADQHRDRNAEYELQRLAAYNRIFEGTDGLMENPPRIHIRESSLRMLDKENNPLTANDYLDRTEDVLFPHPPCIQDVEQGGLGDCYFMASLAALVENDPQFIRKNLRDNGNGTVTVRLYDDGNPFYVNVEKTVVKDQKNRAAYASGSLWVQMYEKALTVSGLMARYMKKDPKEKFDQLDQNHERSYLSIKGGHEDQAMRILTGEKAERISLDEDLLRTRDYKLYAKDRRVVEKNGVISFDGNMAQMMQDVVRDITGALKKKRLVTAGTRENFIQNTGTDPYSGSGQETRERGLSSTHGYTVLGIEKNNGVYYIRLRNPWGLNTVEHIRNELTGKASIREAQEKHYGSFVLDLKTFVTYFRDISVGTHVPVK